MRLPVDINGKFVTTPPDPELATAVCHFIHSEAADSTAVLARMLLGALRTHPSLPLFNPPGHSLFKVAVRRARTDEEYDALDVNDEVAELALNIARYAEGSEQSAAPSLVFAGPPPLAIPRARRGELAAAG